MDIDKAVLTKSFIDKDYDSFFKMAKEITEFRLIRGFNVYNEEERNDMTQECLENLWKKILAGKVDPTQNLMGFIWQNSNFRIMEIFRKRNRRNDIAPMLDYDDETAEWMNMFSGYKYNPELLAVSKETIEELTELKAQNDKNDKSKKKSRKKGIERISV